LISLRAQPVNDANHIRCRELFDEFAFVEWIEKADVNAVFSQMRNFVSGRLSQTQHGICLM